MSQNKPTSVLHVIATLDRAGAEHQMTLLATRLDRARFAPRVVCLTRGGPLEDRLTQAGVPYSILGKSRKWDRRAMRALVGLLSAERPRIVHTWLFTGNTYGRWAVKRAGKRLPASSLPVVVASERSVDTWRRWWHRAIDRRLAKRTDAIVANCRAVADFVIGEGIDPGRVRVIANALDLAAFDEAVRAGPMDAVLNGLADRFVVIQAGRLEPQKAVPDLLAAVDLARRGIPELMLLLVGDGPDRPAIERLIEKRGLQEHVRLLGAREDLPALLTRADVVVLASRWEGMPNVILEAFAARRPVVATEVGGCRELI